jgi:hypothetical protein
MTGKTGQKGRRAMGSFFLLTENHLSKVQIKEKIAIFE